MPIPAIPRMQLKELKISVTWRAKEKVFDRGGIRTQDLRITYVLNLFERRSLRFLL